MLLIIESGFWASTFEIDLEVICYK